MANKKKATFNLNTDILAAINEAVAQGVATSKNALVEQALVRELKELRRQIRRNLWQAAAKDPAFLKDLEEVEAAFRSADAETAQMIG